MGEGADRVTPGDGSAHGRGDHRGDENPRALTRRIEGEIDSVRAELGDIVAELDRRRHELFDVRTQLRQHPMVITTASVAVAAAVGGMVGYAVWKRRRRRRPIERAREVQRAFARILADPDEIAKDPGLMVKALTVVTTTAATVLTKRLIERAIAGKSARRYERPEHAAHAGA